MDRSSSANPALASLGFDQLHPSIQRWIWEQGWPQLRPIQDQAIAPILSGNTDLIIAAATAGGKTEAAFLPIFSRLLQDPHPGIRVLGLSPLKALINDQHRRLSELGDRLEIPVTPWHGDVAASRKQKIVKNPAGIVLITPESFEALLLRRGTDLSSLMAHLAYIVIDEMHCFIGSERGRQVQSLLHRLDFALQRSIPRIGLSATLGDMTLAAAFLRPGVEHAVQLINPKSNGGKLKLQVRGYRKTEAEADQEVAPHELDISRHLFETLRGTRNLIFTNGRGQTEKYADLLRRLSEDDQVPNEFWPHHGSLSKDLREEAEALLKSDRPSNLVCTTTLEMGIDVGDVKSIAQVGAPFSVASTRQRLGRSGRRLGDPAIARFYVAVSDVQGECSPQDALYPELIQVIAILNLLLDGWCEPPIVGQLHLSTLIQQLLSLIVQYGGIRAEAAWHILCRTGPFAAITSTLFAQLLRGLGQHDLIQQSGDGCLLLAPGGDRLVNHYSFYSAFATVQEYRILHNGQAIGNLPAHMPMMPGMQILFGGQGWRIVTVDNRQRFVEVAPAQTGTLPQFSGGIGQIHDRVRQAMRDLYTSKAVPTYLDGPAKALLQEARCNFAAFGLDRTALLKQGQQTLLFCWQGDVVLNTILVQLLAKDLTVSRDAVAITVEQVSPERLMEHLSELVEKGPADVAVLAATVANKLIEKHDVFLSDELLGMNYAASCLDPKKAWETLRQILAQCNRVA